MNKIKIILAITTFLSFQSSAQYTSFKNQKNQKGYEISGEVTGLDDTSIILAYYFGGKQYAKDTAYSKSGKFTFKGEKKLDGGMYLVVLPEQKYFDIIISEQRFSFKTDLKNLVTNMSK